MIYQAINLNEEKTATVTAYVLDNEISYKTKKKRPAVIICPGGGYLMTATKEGEAVAAEFLGKGFHSFVLRYSTYFKKRMTSLEKVPEINENAHYPEQVLELMKTIHLLHENAEKWQIDCENIFVVGFSAGGHIAASLGNYWNDEHLTSKLSFKADGNELKPKGTILGYPMLKGDVAEYMQKNAEDGELIKYQTNYIYDCIFGTTTPTSQQIERLDLKNSINENTPPTFVWTTRNDKIIDSSNTVEYVHEMMNRNLECEFHLFEDGPHGLGLANELYAKKPEDINPEVGMWVPLAINWIHRQQRKVLG